MQGVPYYFVLANPRYYRDFQYICCNVANRDALIVDDDEEEGNDCEQSDMVSILLNLAYIPDFAADHFTFEKGFYAKMKAATIQRQAQKGTANLMKDISGGLSGREEESKAPTTNLMGKLLGAGNK